MKPGILVTGGAGYIGSHTGLHWGEAGENLVILDDLSTGHREAVQYGKFVQGDMDDKALVLDLIAQHNIDTLVHFAAKTCVPESVARPLHYYDNNVAKFGRLLDYCVEGGIKQVIFSSSAAVYGKPKESEVTENTPCEPINPYGASKLMDEVILRDAAKAHGFRFVALRYFNVAGCDVKQRIGRDNDDVPGLVKIVAEAAVGKREYVPITGTDYETPDGTGIRDYIHVDDLAEAHVQALTYLREGGTNNIFNCGYGHGYSVREIIQMAEKVWGKSIPIKIMPRRPGDPACLIANNEKITEILKWKAQHDDLEVILKTALDWEKRHSL